MNKTFTPDIIAFCCHYCAYAAADLAGSMRLDYPPSVKIVEVPCSGKVDPIYVLKALEEGADGVLVAG
jgi:F420-non-reducing hydrogenase iron-sulfur subunit